LNFKAKVLISAGSNIGDRRNYLEEAFRILSESGMSDMESSSVYETPPWGFDAPVPFYNVCFVGYTELSPTRFIQLLVETEEKLGRTRNSGRQYASRTLDLDIILWDRLIIHSLILDIPHPRAHQRRFVLEPAVEIAPDWIHPIFNEPLKILLEKCGDGSEIKKVFPPLEPT